MSIEKELALIDRAKALIGEDNYNQLSSYLRKKILFDDCCPAGGKKVEDELYEGPRYWEKIQSPNKP